MQKAYKYMAILNASIASILHLDAMARSPLSLLFRLAFILLCALLFFSSSSSNGASATTIDVINNCPYPIWPGVQSNAGSITPEMSGFYLVPGAAFPVYAPYSWSGRIWARTKCSFDATTSNFSCATGSCASGAVACNGFGPKPPVSLAQFNLGSSADDAMDYYDISLADGFNVPVKVVPMGFEEKISDCKATQCDSDVDGKCTVEKSASLHICPTAKTPSFKLVFCPVPVPAVNVTKQMPDGLPPVAPPPPMPRINNTKEDLPSTNYKNSTLPAGGNATSINHPPPPPAYAKPPAPASSNDTNHKDSPVIDISFNFTIISEPPAAAPAPASASAPPVSLGRRGFVPVSSAAVSTSTASLLLSATALLVALLALV